jgi:hypothetical protein
MAIIPARKALSNVKMPRLEETESSIRAEFGLSDLNLTPSTLERYMSIAVKLPQDFCIHERLDTWEVI